MREPIVKMWRSSRAGAVHAVQLEQRRAEVRDRLGILLTFQTRGRVEGQIVIEELAKEVKPALSSELSGLLPG